MPGVPGLFLEEQKPGWAKIASAIHAEGGVAYMQLWHSGRANLPHMTGTPILSASATPWDDPEECFMFPPPHTSKPLRYADHPPKEMSVDDIKRTIADYVRTAKWAIECGFDGVEVHGGNGYLIEQFLASNVNKRTDDYGGSPEKRCTFALELMDELSKAIGEENLAIRLTPFGLFNQIRSEQRLETWGELCRKLKENHPRLSYVSFVEPVSLSGLYHCSPNQSELPTNLTTSSATNKSSAHQRNNASSTPGTCPQSICPPSAPSSATHPSSPPAGSTTRTPRRRWTAGCTTGWCTVGGSSATLTCPGGLRKDWR